MDIKTNNTDSADTFHTMPQRKESTGPQLCVTLYIMQVEFEVSNIEINASSLVIEIHCTYNYQHRYYMYDTEFSIHDSTDDRLHQ